MRALKIELSHLFPSAFRSARNDGALFPAHLIFHAAGKRGHGGTRVINDEPDVRVLVRLRPLIQRGSTWIDDQSIGLQVVVAASAVAGFISDPRAYNDTINAAD